MKIVSFLNHDSPEKSRIQVLGLQHKIPCIPCDSRAAVLSILQNESERDNVVFFTHETEIDFIKELSGDYPTVPIVVVLRTPLQKLAKHMSECSTVISFMSTENDVFEEKDFRIILNALKASKLENNSNSLENYLAPDTKFEIALVNTPETKRTALLGVEEFVNNLVGKCKTSRLDVYAVRAAELLDELLLNAVYDANPRLNITAPGPQFRLTPDETATVRWGFDGELFGVSVTDPFGTIQKNVILKHLDEAFRKQEIHKQKTAGLGLKIIYERMSHMIVNAQHGKYTEVICLIRFDHRLRDFEKRLRSFHFFKNQD